MTIKPFQDIPDIPPEESGIEGTMLPLADPIPSLSGQNIVKGLGGKYLAHQSEAASFNTDQKTWQETGFEKEVDVNNRRVLLLFTSSAYCGAAAEVAYLTFSIDDVEQGATTEGLLYVGLVTNGQRVPITMTFVTSILTGTHTFKVEMKSHDGNTVTLDSNTYSNFIVLELSD